MCIFYLEVVLLGPSSLFKKFKKFDSKLGAIANKVRPEGNVAFLKVISLFHHQEGIIFFKNLTKVSHFISEDIHKKSVVFLVVHAIFLKIELDYSSKRPKFASQEARKNK